MRYLLDTNAISDLMANHSNVVGRSARVVQPDQILTCAIVRGEAAYGLARMPDGRRKQDLDAQAATVFRAILVVEIRASAADHYVATKLFRARTGRSMDENDLWIAATALDLGATLVTRDTDFVGVPGLTVEDWTA